MEILEKIFEGLEGTSVYLDTNCFVYFLQSEPPYDFVVRAFLEQANAGHFRIITSEFTLAELLVRPYKEGRSDISLQYRRFLLDDRLISLQPTSLDIFDAASSLRGSLGMSLADAIHVATAISHSCTAFVTNDKGIRVPESMQNLQLTTLVQHPLG